MWDVFNYANRTPNATNAPKGKTNKQYIVQKLLSQGNGPPPRVFVLFVF